MHSGFNSSFYENIPKSLVKLPGFLVFRVCLFWLLLVLSQLSAAAENQNVALKLKSKPDLMLLKIYQPGLEVSGWVMSEKLDGVRAYWDGKNLISRQGNVFNAPAWFTAEFPDFELDGELWLGRNQFAETVSIVRQQVPDNRWSRITYNVFEVPGQQGNLMRRLKVVERFVNEKSAKYLKVIPQKAIIQDTDIQLELKRVLGLKGEGLVVRNPNLPYQTGRLDSVLKVKLKQDAECMVKGYSNGQGKYLGKVGAIICELLPEQLSQLFPSLSDKNNITINIGSGLNDEQRIHPPKIGAIITFQYMGLTKHGLPRFPVFLRERSSVE
ncbi:ATP-dependent DNA ligase [Thiomicrorhabdus immobilis]|uniref:ATP-dependent DNA ligase n=1 Tax=Thiomicrorhabdus immobilis TaxID=2791037 RepID=A0ABM7MBH4_9GAMM|nr:DNA ligase [Thiomicrorhabdus immobilis]BCN92706.1 ATP-dependent DNA ligase [Thiomicrorhabdus immobilis]